MRMEFDELANELSERDITFRTHDKPGFLLEHGDAARTKPGAAYAEAERRSSRRPGAGDKALGQPAFELRRQAHISPFAGELAVRSSRQHLSAFRAVHVISTLLVSRHARSLPPHYETDDDLDVLVFDLGALHPTDVSIVDQMGMAALTACPRPPLGQRPSTAPTETPGSSAEVLPHDWGRA
jgi:hypothetical protein